MRTVQAKLATLSVVTILCLSAFAALTVRTAYRSYHQLARFRQTSAISQAAYEMAKTVTDERQAAYHASGFLGEGTPNEQLERYRQKIARSQQALEQLRAQSEASQGLFSDRFDAGLKSALQSETLLNDLRKEILDPARPQVQDENSRLKTKALKVYDVILLAQANFLPVLCNETEDAELVRKIITQDNIARLQKDIWKVKGIVATALRSGKANEGIVGELKVKLVNADDNISRIRSFGDEAVLAAVDTLSSNPDYKRVLELAVKVRDNVGKIDPAEEGGHANYLSGPSARLESAFAALSDVGTARVLDYTHERLAGARRELLFYVSFSVASLLGNALLLLYVARSITGPLHQVSSELNATAARATESAHIIAESSGQLSSDACDEAAALEEISSSLEELAGMTKSNLEHMRAMAELAERAQRSSDDGVRNANELSQAMDAIAQSTGNVASILKTIDEIAFQTNILALNAAVEAARAGEAGAGFAVVADEVRALAQRSATAARETSEKIELAVRSSARGAELGRNTLAKFSEIAQFTSGYHGKAREVAAASEQSREGIHQVTEAMAKVDAITQRTAAAAEQNASAAAEMKAQVDEVFGYIRRLEEMVVAARERRTGRSALQRKATPATAQPSEPPVPEQTTAQR